MPCLDYSIGSSMMGSGSFIPARTTSLLLLSLAAASFLPSCTKAVTGGAYAIGIPNTFLQQVAQALECLVYIVLPAQRTVLSLQRQSQVVHAPLERQTPFCSTRETSIRLSCLCCPDSPRHCPVLSKAVTGGAYAIGLPHTFPANSQTGIRSCCPYQSCQH